MFSVIFVAKLAKNPHIAKKISKEMLFYLDSSIIFRTFANAFRSKSVLGE